MWNIRLLLSQVAGLMKNSGLRKFPFYTILNVPDHINIINNVDLKNTDNRMSIPIRLQILK